MANAPWTGSIARGLPAFVPSVFGQSPSRERAGVRGPFRRVTLQPLTRLAGARHPLPQGARVCLRARVKLVVYGLQVRVIDVRVDLRRRDARVTEHLLHNSHICAAGEHVRGEAVP